MKKIIYLFFILIFNTGIAQTNETILNSFKFYQNKAVWFQNMPHFNQDSSRFYFKKAIFVLQKKPSTFSNELATIYFQFGEFNNVHFSLNALDSLANIGWSHLKKKNKNNKNKELEYRFLSNWASIKLELGQNKNAIKLFSKALALSENFENPDFKAEIILDKGVFYERYKLEKEKNTAYENLNKSKKYFESKDQKSNALLLFKNYKALVGFFDDRNNDSVFYYSDKIKSILKHITIPQRHAWYYVTYGRDLVTFPRNGQKNITQQQYDEGKKNLLKSLAILEKYNIKECTIIPYANGILADIYIKEKKYELAIENYKKSKKGYEFLRNNAGAIDMNQYIAEAYKLNGDLENALVYYKEFYKKSLAFQNQRNEQSLRENELQFNIVKQEKLIARKQNEQTIFGVVLLVVLSLLGLLFWSFKQKQKNNKILAILNDDLGSKNTLLDSKNAENELLLREIHHRVKNNLEIVSSLLSLQSAQIEDINTKDVMAESQNRVNSIGIVHQKLYQGTNLGVVEMKDYFLNLGESILESFGAEERIDLNLSMENLDLDIDTAVPLGLIVNELITNAIKYAFPKGKNGIITIKLHKTENILLLEVADNGVGKSGKTIGTGFGTQLVSLLTQQLNGTMTEENFNGTRLVFEFKA